MKKSKYFVFTNSQMIPRSIYRQNDIGMKIYNRNHNHWLPAANTLSQLEPISRDTARNMHPAAFKRNSN